MFENYLPQTRLYDSPPHQRPQDKRVAIRISHLSTARSRFAVISIIEDKELFEYEQDHILKMVAEHLKNLVSTIPGIRKIILQSHVMSADIKLQLENIMPEVDICIVNTEKLLDMPTKSDVFIAAWQYQTLLDRCNMVEADMFRQCSIEDVFGNCRMLPGEINFT